MIELSLSEQFEAQVERTPAATALVFGAEQLTYAELDRRSNQLAHHLVSLGVSPDSLVAVCLDRSLELFVALLGILKAGAAYLPLDPSYPPARLSFMLTDAGSPLLLTTERLAGNLPTPSVLLDSDWDVIALNKDEALVQRVVSADQLAYVMYTSGSTGTPKGVAVTHRAVVRLVTAPNYVRLDAEQTLLQLAPLTFDASTFEVWGALLNGGRLVVMPPSVPALDEISRVIVAEKVTTLWLTAGLFQLMVDEQLEGLSQVTQLLAGGDVLSVRHVEKYLAAISNGDGDRRLINGYGPTENTTFTCCHVMDGSARLNGSVPIGGPITNTQIHVLDTEMQVVPVGVVGELYIGGAGLARGYFKQPELTAEKFVPHPHSSETGERLYRTGDMVRWRESGELEFVGRMDGQVKIRGFRIELGEIEAVLVGHAGVREAVVLVREDERGDKRLAAYVVQDAASEVSAGELKEYLQERLPEYMQVQWVVAVAELPLTANGKVDRRALQELSVEVERGEMVLARTPVEEILSAIWAEVLGRDTVSVQDNFFELGGHSLLATQMISRIRNVFGQEVSLRMLLENPTVASLAQTIESEQLRVTGPKAPPVVRVERADRAPASFAQQRLWFLDQLESGSVFCNVATVTTLTGTLNREVLERTLTTIIQRHEILRTTFTSVDGKPWQIIAPAAPFHLPLIDLSEIPDKARETETRRLISEEVSQPFDLERGPLVRGKLLRLSAEQHVVLLTMHHIVLDLWSIGIFVREVATLYRAFHENQPSPLEELPVQYADFAHWQRQWFQGQVLEQQVCYWRQQLVGAPAVLELRGKKPTPVVLTFRAAKLPFALSKELVKKLHELGRQTGMTLFMSLLAAFDVLLYRYSGQSDLPVGTLIANRNHFETESLIGFFINTLVLRTDLSGDPTFIEVLRRVREVCLEAYAHQELPFAKLVEELQPDRTQHSSLFQVMFMLQKVEMEKLELPGLSLSIRQEENRTATKVDLLLTMYETKDGMGGFFKYNTDVFDDSTIAKMIEHFQTLIENLLADPEQHLSDSSFLTEDETMGLTSADFPESGLSQKDFESLILQLNSSSSLK